MTIDCQHDEPELPPRWLMEAMGTIKVNVIGPASLKSKRNAVRLLRGLETDHLQPPIVEMDATGVMLVWKVAGREAWIKVSEDVVFWAYRETGPEFDEGETHKGDFEFVRCLLRWVFPESRRGFCPDVLDRLMADEESRVVR